MHAIFAICAAVLAADQPAIEGAWQGTGRHARYLAVFRAGKLTMRIGTDPILEPRESRFSVNAAQGTIDIVRSDGLQLGRYAVEGNKLTIMLADVNLPRPNSLEFPKVQLPKAPFTIDRKTWKPPTQARYEFDRVR